MSRRWVWIGAAVASVCLVGGGLWWWRFDHERSVPEYVSRANGRLEMTRIDIAVKNPGRVVDLPIHEGDRLHKGDVVAREDEAEVLTQIRGVEAQRQRASMIITRAEAELDVRRNHQRLAQLEWAQTVAMRGKAFVSQVELDRRRIALDGESAGLAVANGAVNEARAALAEIDAQIARLKINLDDMTIRAPTDGQIEYRIVEQGAVMPAGGRIASLLEYDDLYMTVFLPSKVVGKVKIGDEARIMLDAFEDVLPAQISFIASEAQFTPKFVETRSERDKLVYRVKLKVPVEVARRFGGSLKAGLTGYGYVRADAKRPWPVNLAIATSDEGGK